MHFLPKRRASIDPRPRTDHCQTGSKCRKNDRNPIVVAMPDNAPTLSKGGQHTYDRWHKPTMRSISAAASITEGANIANVMCLLTWAIVKQNEVDQGVGRTKRPIPGLTVGESRN